MVLRQVHEKDIARGMKMCKVKTPTERSRWWIPKEDFKTAVHWALRYPLWVAELSIDPDTSRAIVYDKDKVQTSGGFDATSELAIRREELSRKKDLLERVVDLAGHDIYRYLLLGVTEGLTVYQLIDMGMPCSKDYYVDRRQRFYYELSRRI